MKMTFFSHDLGLITYLMHQQQIYFDIEQHRLALFKNFTFMVERSCCIIQLCSSVDINIRMSSNGKKSFFGLLTHSNGRHIVALNKMM